MRFYRVGNVTSLAVAAIAMTVLTTGCTSDDDKDADPPTPSTSSAPTEEPPPPPPPDAPFQVAVRQIGGGIGKADRQRIRAAVAKPISAYFDGAFVGGTYPRDDFSAGFRSWTPDAAKLAERRPGTTTNVILGKDAVDVTTNEQRADLYVFARNGNAGGATARVRVRLTETLDDGSSVKVAFSGSLYLTRNPNGWKIFGFDLSRKVVSS